MIVLGVEPPSSIAISVNMTPTTQLFEYHPVTSVSRVEAESADRIFPRILPFLSEGRCVAHVQKKQHEGLSRALASLSLKRDHAPKRLPRPGYPGAPSEALSEIGLNCRP